MTSLEKDIYLSVPKTSKYLEPKRNTLIEEITFDPEEMKENPLENIPSTSGLEETSSLNFTSSD